LAVSFANNKLRWAGNDEIGGFWVDDLGKTKKIEKIAKFLKKMLAKVAPALIIKMML
jgi:hypothetical protein